MTVDPILLVRGDVAPPSSQDGQVTMADGFVIIGYYYGQTDLECMDAADVNGTDGVTMGDRLRAFADALHCISHAYCVPGGKPLGAKSQ